MFLHLRHHGIELEEKTASKSVSKWPRESLRDSRNYIMALGAFKIVASRLCFFLGGTPYSLHVFAPAAPWDRVRGKTASKSVSNCVLSTFKYMSSTVLTVQNDVFVG